MHFTTVTAKNGKVKKVRNLGWLLNHWKEVERIEVTQAPKGETFDAILTAKLGDGRIFSSSYASFEVLNTWLRRPVFLGLPLVWLGVNGTITKTDIFGEIRA